MPKRPYLIDKVPEVQELLDQGKTQVQTSVETGVSARTISRWLKEGPLRRGPPIPVEAAPQDTPVRTADQEEWTARSLLDLGMDPDVVDSVLHLVEDKAAVGGQRWDEWLSGYVSLAARIPQEWAAAIAFLPILGRDICSPTLEELAALMYESAPWGGKQLRSRYAGQADPLLANIRAELMDWHLFAGPWETRGPGPLIETGVIFEVFLRCPHVDGEVRRSRGLHRDFKKCGLHPLTRMPMGALAMVWGEALDRKPRWLAEYANYRKEHPRTRPDARDQRLMQIRLDKLERRSLLEWLGWGTLWGR